MPIGNMTNLNAVVAYTMLLPSSERSDRFDIDEPTISKAAGTVMLPIIVRG